jgi:3-hydroxyisobutyrate dehydrogenase
MLELNNPIKKLCPKLEKNVSMNPKIIILILNLILNIIKYMSCKVSFIGLGVMGYPMAGFISKAGHNVTVYNRTNAKAEKWIKEYKGKIASTPEEAAKDSDFIFTCVGNDNDLKEVAIGKNGIFNSAKKGAIYIDNTTASAAVARELHKKAKIKGIGFLDAPVSGGQAGAESGNLTVMVGGDKEHFDKAKSVIDAYSKKIQLLGSSGSGQLAKMVNQICIAGLVQGLSEAINFGLNAGLKMEDVIEVISKGAAQSWQMENRYKTMIDDKFEFGFAVDWMRKDLKIAIEEAKKNNSPLPVTKIVDSYYEEIQKMGGNRWDTSSLIRRFRKK